MDGAAFGGSRERQAYGLAAGSEPLTRLGDSPAAKTPRMGDLDSFRFRDGEYIEGMTLTHHLNQMKLSAFVAIAAVIGGSFILNRTIGCRSPRKLPFRN